MWVKRLAEMALLILDEVCKDGLRKGSMRKESMGQKSCSSSLKIFVLF